MTVKTSLWQILSVLALPLASGGCGGGGDATPTPPLTAPPATTNPAAAAPTPPATVTSTAAYMGLYRGDWGTMVLRQVGAEVWGAYAHDDGAVRGTIVGNEFTGRWCEDPERAGDSDAGNVHFAFTMEPDGTLAIDGAWSYGDAPPDQADWDVTLRPGETDADLEAKFADPAHFCR